MANVNDPLHSALLWQVVRHAEALGFSEHYDFTPGERTAGGMFRHTTELTANLVRTRTDSVLYHPELDLSVKVDAKTDGWPYGDNLKIEALPFLCALTERETFGVPYLFACSRRDSNHSYGLWARPATLKRVQRLVWSPWKMTRQQFEPYRRVVTRILGGYGIDLDVMPASCGGSGDPMLVFCVDQDPVAKPWWECLEIFTTRAQGRAQREAVNG